MYGRSAVEFPQRIVCLTAETAEIAYRVGAGHRVVGVPGTARRPEAVRDKARVGGALLFAVGDALAGRGPRDRAGCEELARMTRRCELTGKLPLSGQLRSHAENKTKRKFRPNLCSVTLLSDTLGRKVRRRASPAFCMPRTALV